MFTCLKSEPSLWTVGTYDGKGKWCPESDHPSADEAAARARLLNGAMPASVDTSPPGTGQASRRDLFAAHALAGLLAGGHVDRGNPADAAELAFKLADAMIRQSARK